MPLPKIGDPIVIDGATVTADSDTLQRLWNDYLVPLVNAAESGGTGASYPLALFGPGRIAALDYTTTDSSKSALSPSPALSIRFKAGTLYEVADEDGAVHDFIIPPNFDLIGIPPGLSNAYAYLIAVKPEDSDSYTLDWHPDGFTTSLQSALTAAGYPCVGRLSSGADEVTAYDTTGEDVIFTNALMRKILSGLSSSGSGGGGTIDLSDYDLKADRIAADEELRALIAAVGAGPQSIRDNFDTLANLAAVTMQRLSEVNPHAPEAAQISVVSGMGGLGQNDTPNVSPNIDSPLQLAYDSVSETFS